MIAKRIALAAALATGIAAQERTGPLITLSVRDESVANLLQALAVQHRLSLVAGDQVTGKVSINLFDVPLHDALRQILATQGLDFVEQNGFYRVLTIDQKRALAVENDPIETRVFPMNHLATAEAQKLLQPLLSPDGTMTATETSTQGAQSGSGGGAAPNTGGHHQALLVVDRRSVLDRFGKTLAELDRAPAQVLLEATILSVDLGEDNRLGVDLNVLGGIDFNSIGAVSDMTGITGYDVSGTQFDNPLVSGQTLGFTGNPPTDGLAFGFVQNNVAAFIDALERTTNATIVSNPRVIALNGQQAQIIVGGRLGYSTITQTQTSSIETVQFLETGTQLTFRPFVGNDGWIRMEVHPQNSSGVIDPVSGIPSEATTEITTKILMRDGQTLVLGGLIGESITTARDQIPVLGDLPLVGFLFGRTTESVTRRELVILLTPHILDPVESKAKADEARQRLAAVRRSHWDALSPYLRPVVARRHFADARALRARGQLEQALGAVERALALDPTDLDAAVLRDELLEELALRSLPRSDADAALDILRSLPPEGTR